MEEQINLGNWTAQTFDELLRESAKIASTGSRIEFLSKQFLNTPYKKSTLIGDIDTPEIFVINLGGIDCFTFLDYIEAMRISISFSEFTDNLKKVRYKLGEISYKKRNHFFTDWAEFNSSLVTDISVSISNGKNELITKKLNEKNDGTQFLPGISLSKREIVYVPSLEMDDFVMGKLNTGDYIGVYSETQGLDVSHVGIIVIKKNTVSFRHASSKHQGVIDEDFIDYITDKPGIIALRPIQKE
jgi:hypothetical protein